MEQTAFARFDAGSASAFVDLIAPGRVSVGQPPGPGTMGRGARRLAGDRDRSTVEPELEHLIFGTGDDGVDRSSEVYNLEVWQA